MKIIIAPGGTARRVEDVTITDIPDMWHVAEYLEAHGEKRAAEGVKECWHLCHDLFRNLKMLEQQGVDLPGKQEELTEEVKKWDSGELKPTDPGWEDVDPATGSP